MDTLPTFAGPKRSALMLIGFLAAAAGMPLRGADWPQFRGAQGRGIADAKNLPETFNATAAASKNMAWKTDLPGRGLSSPIIIGDLVAVTASSGYRQDRLHVLGFKQESGEKLWERQFWATGMTMCHPKTCMAAPTPASDGKRIFALFSTNDVIALDLQGNLLWLRGLTLDYPGASNSVGMSSSPVVAGDTLIVLIENDTNSFAAGLDVRTGANRWKIPRPAHVNWTSPLVFRQGDRDAVLLQSLSGLSAVNPATGEALWNHPSPCDAIASLVFQDEVLYVPLASGKSGIAALKPNADGAPPTVLWESNRLRASTASPLAIDNKLVAIAGSILKCGNARTGELLWQLRLTGSFSSSPVAAGNRIYCFNEDGLCQVVQLGDQEGKIIGTGELGETILSTPAIAQDALFIRADGHLWKIAARL